MKRAIEAAAVVALGLLLTAAVEAQEAPAPTPKQVTVRPGLTITDQDALAVYVETKTDTPDGQFARIELWVALADEGFVRVTRCDDLVVPCDPLVIRAEGVNQGDGGALVWE